MIKDLRLAALRRFAVAITILNIAGHAFLGFEQSLAQVFASLATAYGMEIGLEAIDARANQRSPRFIGGPGVLIDFLLPSHITGLAVAMLLYANDQIFPIVFATTVAIGSKALFRAPIGNGRRHFFNPSNFGIAATLLIFPWVGIAPPYQFTENLGGIAHWILPCIFILTGSFLNARFTRRIPLIVGWVGGFAIQALIRNLLYETSWTGGLAPMTGVAFLLFTFYMVTDPGTTPVKRWNQVVFGAGVALAYAILMTLHIAFGLFFALVIVCTLRGLGLYVLAARRVSRVPELPAHEPTTVVLRQAEL
ncbi:MAG TPA: enediyne biosynthesis protein UnbU [Blastocatellia bacterium]|nr:enediyne biosynthesis protein UnbU [Blastocatellia bacterium]